ncbi:hypothetical protein AHAS_Ahas11G0252000 [Arachis hypogaea]
MGILRPNSIPKTNFGPIQSLSHRGGLLSAGENHFHLKGSLTGLPKPGGGEFVNCFFGVVHGLITVDHSWTMNQ